MTDLSRRGSGYESSTWFRAHAPSDTQIEKALWLAPGLIGAFPKYQRVLTCLLAVAVSGCATVYEGRYDFHDGWRKARIEAIGTAAEFGAPASADCRSVVAGEQLTISRFAKLSYSNVGRQRTRVAVLPTNSTFDVGDLVYFKLGSCRGEVVRRSGDAA